MLEVGIHASLLMIAVNVRVDQACLGFGARLQLILTVVDQGQSL